MNQNYSITTYNPYEMAVTPSDYVKIVGVDECAFWGVNSSDGTQSSSCTDLWTEQERFALFDALASAQAGMEEPLSYPLTPRWITGLIEDQPSGYLGEDFRFVDTQPFSYQLRGKWGMMISPGILRKTVAGFNATIDYSVEPAEIEVTSVNYESSLDFRVVDRASGRFIEIESFHDDCLGTLTFRIPRCRLIRADVDPGDNGLLYDNDDNFLTEVDVYLYEVDPSKHAEIISSHTCDWSCSTNGCSNYITDACMVVKNERISQVQITPATYENRVWTKLNQSCRGQQVRLNYRAGAILVPPNIKMAVVRYAHTLMAEEPCGCPEAQSLWEKDRAIPPFITPQRDQCPFGLMDGAWWCWKQLQTNRVARASVL